MEEHRPERCDSTCTHWHKCKKPKTCPVLAKQLAENRRAKNKPIFPSSEEIDKEVEKEMFKEGDE